MSGGWVARSRRRAALTRPAVLVVALGLLVAACGGGGGTTRADYVRQANRVCRNAALDIAKLQIPGRADVAAMPKTAAEVVAIQRRALTRLQALSTPKKDRAQIARWIALVDQTLDQAEQSATAQRQGDIPRALTANANGAALDQRADEFARRYGIESCVQAATPPPPPASTTTTTTRSSTTSSSSSTSSSTSSSSTSSSSSSSTSSSTSSTSSTTNP